MPRILPLRTGWDPLPSGAQAYPPDLPPQWRLTYFANDYWGVLVPPDLWCGIGVDEARAWVLDTPPRFRFFLDLGMGRALDALAPLGRALGDRLGGVVGFRSELAAIPDAGLERLLRIPPDREESWAPPGFGTAWEVPAGLVGDLRGARAWVEARVAARDWTNWAKDSEASAFSGAEGPVVALLGDCGFEELGRWQTLLELMGLA